MIERARPSDCRAISSPAPSVRPLQRGRTLTSLIEEGLRLIVAEGRRAASIDAIRAAKHGDRPPGAGHRHIQLRRASGNGDLEYVERLKNGFK